MAEQALDDEGAAALIGISRSQVSRIKRGINKPSPETAVRLEAVTGIPAWDFLKPSAA